MSKIPDQILDIRVFVPHDAVGQYILRIGDRWVPIAGIYPAIDRASTSAINNGLDATSLDRKAMLQDLVDGAHIRCDVLIQRVGALENHIQGILSVLDVCAAEDAQQTERIDNLEKHCEALQGKIKALERRETASEAVQRMRREGAFDAPKRVIKGGWVNVWRPRCR